MGERGGFVTTEGLEVRVRPVSRLVFQKLASTVEAEMRAQGKPLDPPTYTVTTGVGAVETHPHDDLSADTPELKAALEAHREARRDLESETNQRRARIMLSRGIIMDPPSAEWIAAQKADGIDLPTDAKELAWEYLQIEVLKTPADQARAMGAITILSMDGASPEAIQAVEASFRDLLQGRAVGGEDGAATAGAVDLSPDVRSGAGS